MKMNDRYTYRVSWSGEDQEYVATCIEFPSPSWLANSPEKSLSGMRKLMAECIARRLAALAGLDVALAGHPGH